MAKVTIEVSEELAALILTAEVKLEEQAKAAKAFAPLDVDGTQAAIREATSAVGKDLQRRWLQSLDSEEATVVIDKTLGKPVHKTLDFWHLTEKLGRAAVVMRGEARASALLESWKLALLNRSNAWQRILSQLRASGFEHVRIADARPVHDAITYLENHAERLDYAEARRHGMPIGSGHVEATCKSLSSF